MKKSHRASWVQIPPPRTKTAPPNSRAVVEYVFWMRKDGYREAAILRYGKLIRTIGKTANLFDAERLTTFFTS